MFTTLTVIVAWFSFGYCAADILIDVVKYIQFRRNNGTKN